MNDKILKRPPPQIIASHFAREVVTDEIGSMSIIDVINAFIVQKVPSHPITFHIFVSMSEGKGAYPLKAKLYHFESGETLWAEQGSIVFPDRVEPKLYVRQLMDISFPALGLYLLEVQLGEDQVLCRRLMVYLEQPKKGTVNGSNEKEIPPP